MARIPIWNENDPATPADSREALLEAGRKFGTTFNIMRGIANHPKALTTFIDFALATYGSGSITPAQAELAYLTASSVNKCFY